MIKLPIVLRRRPQWKEAVQEALAMQAKLEGLAQEEEKATGEYIRPIVLLQAQSKGEGHITFDLLKKSLLEDFNVPEEQILIATGAKNELDGVVVLDRPCPVRFIITVAKLREGWDCPFAYILCSVSSLSSKTAVEQVIGRVLRMPHAHRKQQDDLNHAYAFVTAQGFVEAANALTDALVESGFDPYEARASVKPQADPSLPLDLPLWQAVTEMLPGEPTAEAIPEGLRERIEIAPAKAQIETGAPGLTATLIRYSGPGISQEDEKAWAEAVTSEDEKSAIERLARKSRGEDAWPAAIGKKLAVPWLTVRVGDQLQLFEDQFREGFWALSDCDPELTEREFSLPVGPETGAEIDVEDGKIGWRSFTDVLHRDIGLLLDLHAPKTDAELAVWLDRAIAHPDITQTEAAVYLSKVIEYVKAEHGMSLDQLTANRFRLRDAVAEKIRSLRESAATDAYQRMLLPESATSFAVTPERCFTFPLNQYPAPSIYDGRIDFSKHYYERPAAMNGEEAACAAYIDALPQVEFWVRNLERDGYAFWLQTPTDKFYPDFVVKLKDGRFLVVEYKGSHIDTAADATEKDAIGRFWEARSEGSCIFRMVGKDTVKELASAVQ